MTVLDAYALVALVADEPAAGEVEELLRAGGCRASVVNVAETVEISLRMRGFEINDSPRGEARAAAVATRAWP